MTAVAEKPRWVLIARDEAAALMEHGKYREHLPTWVSREGAVWALVNEQLTAWRELRAGNSLKA